MHEYIVELHQVDEGKDECFKIKVLAFDTDHAIRMAAFEIMFICSSFRISYVKVERSLNTI